MSKKGPAPAALLALLSLWHLPAAAQLGPLADEGPPPEGRRYVATAVRVSTPPVIDGRMDDPAWSLAPPITGFVQHEPREGEPATERTEVRIVYDDQALYIGAWLFDATPAAIVEGEHRRDANLQDSDAFRVVLDTYHDRQNGFVFGTTPAGIEYDGQVSEGGAGRSGGGRQQAGPGRFRGGI